MAAKGGAMKFWFTKKTPKDVYDVKAPFDATVEQALRVAQEVNTAPVETDREVFDFIKAFQAAPAGREPAPPQHVPSASALPRPTVSRAARDEMDRRVASYRAFQMRLNEEREARIRRTMDGVRAQLKAPSAPDPASH
jgi:hypothetical protein